MKKKQGIFIFAIIVLIAIVSILIINKLNNGQNGELKKISYEEINQKLENEEDFILIISQSTCSHCVTYKPKVKKIAQKYGIIVYYIDYDKLSNKKEFLTQLNLNGATPMTLFFENGKEKSILNRIEGDVASETIKEKFKKMGFI